MFVEIMSSWCRVISEFVSVGWTAPGIPKRRRSLRSVMVWRLVGSKAGSSWCNRTHLHYQWHWPYTYPHLSWSSINIETPSHSILLQIISLSSIVFLSFSLCFCFFSWFLVCSSVLVQSSFAQFTFIRKLSLAFFLSLSLSIAAAR